ncbi:MAG TPA: hypothetical protein VG870_06665 [Chitinophagaceae bacterium]|nr:hypothetical protein [Chitinophagaceae bacterium]
MKISIPGIVFIVGGLLGHAGLHAQSNSSPYSILGIGDLEDNMYNRTSGMANTGIAYRNSQYLINNNPASYAVLANQLFIAELGGRGRLINYSGSDINSTNNKTKDFAIRRLSLGMRLTKWWGSSAGLMPFSTANYNFYGTKYIQGTQMSTPATYEGSGGVNQVYWANGFKITKNLSVGINSSLLWGSLQQKETLTSTDLATSLATQKNIYLINTYFNYGAQYFARLNKKWDLGLGVTYAAPRDLKAQYTATITSGTGTQISNNIIKNDFFQLPANFGGGLTLTRNKSLTIAADYKYANWSSTHYQGMDYQLVNSNRISAGVESSKKVTYYNTSVEKIYWQMGAYYSNSYLQVYGRQLQDRGVTVGLGVNSKRSTLGYHIGLNYGILGSRANGLIRENYFAINLSFSYREIWETRGKKYF